MRETSLYDPIKQFLVKQGYEVKAEVAAADVVGVRGDEQPVIVELKTGFTLSLFHQAIERQAITDLVYIAVPEGKGQRSRGALKKNKSLCRRLGVGLITVRSRDGLVVVHLNPAPYKPRHSKRKKAQLLSEFQRREGDPNTGGASGTKIMTAYRQDAIRCVKYLAEHGVTKASVVAQETEIPNARQIMASNHYGWFQRAKLGFYELDPQAAGQLSEYTSN